MKKQVRARGKVVPLVPKATAFATLATLKAELDPVRQQLIALVQVRLDELVGNTYGDVEANQAVTAAIQQLLTDNGLRVECPECHQPATIHCRKAGRVKDGYFQYIHSGEGRIIQHGGDTALPPLKVVAAPPSQRRKATRKATKSE